MYRKEVNERSPMRVFEKSLHGGLGRGNVGVTVARPGVGKTGFLVQLALDDLLRNKKVLHISHEYPVDHVRAYYDEIFHDLALAHDLVQAQIVRVEMERNRLIYSHLDPEQNHADAPRSNRGGRSSVQRIEESVNFAKEVAHFSPDAVIIDGFDFAHATTEAVDALKAIAKRLDAEMWLSARTEDYPDKEPGSGPDSTPTPLRQFYAHLDVIVLLNPEGKKVRLQLLKDHDNADVEELHLLLDPTTMRILDEDMPPASPRRREPTRFHLVSGGAKGAESEFGACAERWGMKETHYSFDGHPFRARDNGVRVLDEMELKKGDFSLVYASHRLKRPLSNIPEIKRILQTVWHQITAASEVFVIGKLEDNGNVKGGTGWGAELARLWSKPLHVFDQEKGVWFRWDGASWQESDAPVIQRPIFAGVGTTRLNDQGKKAIHDLFERSFGAPPNP
jgi:KaiC/GvpD/RAD55 family RecA-like ATPase